MSQELGFEQLSGIMNNFTDSALRQLPAWGFIAGVLLFILAIVRFRDYCKSPGSVSFILPVMYVFFGTVLITIYIMTEFGFS